MRAERLFPARAAEDRGVLPAGLVNIVIDMKIPTNRLLTLPFPLLQLARVTRHATLSTDPVDPGLAVSAVPLAAPRTRETFRG